MGVSPAARRLDQWRLRHRRTIGREELVALLPGSLLFDPELLGALLRVVVPPEEQTDDSQDLAVWRHPDTRGRRIARERPPRSRRRADDRSSTTAYFEQVVGGDAAKPACACCTSRSWHPADVIGAQRLRARGAHGGLAVTTSSRPLRRGAPPSAWFAEHLDASVATAGPSDLARADPPRSLAEPVVPARGSSVRCPTARTSATSTCTCRSAPHRCGYCDFVTVVGRRRTGTADYVDALLRRARARARRAGRSCRDRLRRRRDADVHGARWRSTALLAGARRRCSRGHRRGESRDGDAGARRAPARAAA